MAMRFLSNGCNLFHVDWEGETKREREKLRTIKNNYSAMAMAAAMAGTFKLEEKFFKSLTQMPLLCFSHF